MQTAEFYDQFMTDLWYRDLRYINYRVEAIKKLINRFVPKNSFVLEIGCGNGLVTKSICRRARNVLAVDISPVAIENASKYVNNRKCIFWRGDVFTDPDLLLFSPIEVIVLADVLEHIESYKRALLFTKLANFPLVHTIILTWPHPKAQEHEPQFIEEPVDIMEILALTDFKLFHFSWANVDGKNKYAHCVLKKDISYVPIKRSFAFKLLNIAKKIKHRLSNLRLIYETSRPVS